MAQAGAPGFGRADDGDLPDFFRGGSADGSGDLAFGGLEDELDLDLDGLTFGGGFDIPLTGLPEFEAAGPASSEAAASGPAARAGGQDELAAITGEATDAATWQAQAQAAAQQAQRLQQWTRSQPATARAAAAELSQDPRLQQLLALAVGEEDEEEAAATAALAARSAGRSAAAALRGPTGPAAAAPAGPASRAPPGLSASQAGRPGPAAAAAPAAAPAASGPPGATPIPLSALFGAAPPPAAAAAASAAAAAPAPAPALPHGLVHPAMLAQAQLHLQQVHMMLGQAQQAAAARGLPPPGPADMPPHLQQSAAGAQSLLAQHYAVYSHLAAVAANGAAPAPGPGGRMVALPPQAQAEARAALAAYAALVYAAAAGAKPGQPQPEQPQAQPPAAAVKVHPGQPGAPAPSAAEGGLPGPAYVHPSVAGHPAYQRPLTVASLLSQRLPTDPRSGQVAIGGRFMGPRDVGTVIRMMHNTLANAGDVMSECYYLFALRAKRQALAAQAALAEQQAAAGGQPPQTGSEAAAPAPAAAAGASSSGASLPSFSQGGNALDVAAVLAAMAEGGAAAAAPSKGGRRDKDKSHAQAGKEQKEKDKGSKPSAAAAAAASAAAAPSEDVPSKTGPLSAPGDGATTAPAPAAAAPEDPLRRVAASLLASLPVASFAQRNVARNQEELRRLGMARRRLWEQHNQVLGRIASLNVRAPRQVLNLTASGITTAKDISSRKRSAAPSTAVGGGSAAPGGAEEEEEAGEEEPEDEAGAAADGAAAEGGSSNRSDPLLWLARLRVEGCLDTIMRLQEAARSLQAHLRTFPPPPPDALDRLKAEVARLRSQLAKELGLRAPVTVAAAAQAAAKGGKGGRGGRQAQPSAASLSPSDLVEDDAVLSLLSVPKGKRLLVRAVPMLAPLDRVTAVAAGMRHLPHFVASAAVGPDAEAADAELGAALARWTQATQPPAGGVPLHSRRFPADAAAAAPAGALTVPATAQLSMLGLWVRELQGGHSGSIVRALLQHGAASEVISGLLFRGEREAEAAEAALAAPAAAAGGSGDAAAAPPVAAPGTAADRASVSLWRETTEALGRAFVEAS